MTELPPIEAHITEYQCQCVVCPECGKATQAELPREAQGQFGPQLTALIAYLTVVCRMPRRMVQELLQQVLGIPLSLGSIQNSLTSARDCHCLTLGAAGSDYDYEQQANNFFLQWTQAFS